MDLKNKKRELKERYFSTGGLIIISILGIAGILFIVFSGIFSINSTDTLYKCIAQNGIMIIFGSFFFLLCIYCWYLYFVNIILNPKKEILYLHKNEQNEIYFLNKKGKKFTYKTNDIKENHYYYVLKTRDYIYEVLEETNEEWTAKEKKSYWLNFYSPMGNFEDIFLLPIVYVILLPGLLSFIMAKGYAKIYGIIFMIVPIYGIIYDLIYKIKLKKSNYNEIDDTALLNSYEILKNIISITIATIIAIILMIIFYTLSDIKSKLIFSPFLGCGICSIGATLSKTFKNYKLENIFLKGYIVIFLIFWFGFLIFWTYGIVKQESSYIPVLFSIPFWLAGFFMIYKYFIKK